MFEKESEKRFKVVFKEGKMTGNKILEDRETGVQYLFSWDGYAGGITPLLDKEGKPVVNSNKE
jgi:Family of unknown function (DUF6440)